jgi:hypothetical protein
MTKYYVLVLVAITGCSKPETVAKLDMNTYWYSASAAADLDTHCQTLMTIAGGSKVKCQ